MNDTTMGASAACVCAVRANIPALDKQSTKVSASTSAQLGKQRAQYLGKPAVFCRDAHTFFRPVPGLITPWDTWIDSVSWSGAGGLDEAVEIQDAAGQTIWRGMAQAVDDSSFALVKVGRWAKGGYKISTLDSGRLDVTVGRPLRNAGRSS